MPDTLILLSTGRGAIACDNCGTTQTHEVRLYWNDTTGKLEVQKECKCFSEETKYQEDFDVLVPTKA